MPGLDELAFSLNAIADRCREAADGALVRELRDRIGEAVAPVPAAIRAELGEHMPHRYADTLDADVNIFRRTFFEAAGGEARVSLYATNRGSRRRKLRRLEAGVLWHPLFGRFPRSDPRNRWFEQGPGEGVHAGWFSGPVEQAVPRVRQAVQQALDEVAAKAAGRGL